MEENVIIVDGIKYYKYYTLYVTKKGEVFNSKFKRLVPKNNCIWFSELKARLNKDESIKRKKYKVNRIVYEAVSGNEIDNHHRVINIDGDAENYAFENLKVVKISDVPVNYDYKKYYKISPEDRIKIREDKVHTPTELAKQYNVTIATIQKIKSGCVGRGWHKQVKNVEFEERKRKAL